MVLEKTLESLFDCKEIQPVHPKGDPSWVFIGGTDVEADTPILWPPDAKNLLYFGKDPDPGKEMGKQWKQCQTLFGGAPKSLQMVIAAMKLKDAYSLEGKL